MATYFHIDMDKPDGLTLIRPEDVDGFIKRLPIQQVPGVGKKTFQALELMGIKTLGDVGRFPEKLIEDRFGKYGRRLMALAAGLLDQYRLEQKIRLVGVGGSGLTEQSPPVQLDLFERRARSNANWERVDRAVDSIQSKFGKGAIQRAGFSSGEKQ